jgi:hypothetical protein
LYSERRTEDGKALRDCPGGCAFREFALDRDIWSFRRLRQMRTFEQVAQLCGPSRAGGEARGSRLIEQRAEFRLPRAKLDPVLRDLHERAFGGIPRRRRMPRSKETREKEERKPHEGTPKRKRPGLDGPNRGG